MISQKDLGKGLCEYCITTKDKCKNLYCDDAYENFIAERRLDNDRDPWDN